METARVEAFLCRLQDKICERLTYQETGGKEFLIDDWSRGSLASGSTRVMSDGEVIEKAGVNYSNFQGPELPATASERHPECAGAPFHVMGVSVVVHPRNPYAPTSHMNVRFFKVMPAGGDPVWWFGGGFDLTPHYPFDDDIVAWHREARDACEPFGPSVYSKFKDNCDTYFFNKHRGETRGVGGLFYDDYNEPDFESAFALTQAVGEGFIRAYEPILEKRKATPYSDRERQFQLYRRGRYVEFNLVYDRGTLFGLQSGGRIESILMSLPPLARWDYAPKYPPDSPEARLQDYLKPRDWV